MHIGKRKCFYHLGEFMYEKVGSKRMQILVKTHFILTLLPFKIWQEGLYNLDCKDIL